MKKSSTSLVQKLVALIYCVAVSFTGVSQTYTLDTLNRKFDRFREVNLQEKVFLHTDRNFYVVGEILWFKVYCVDGSYHKPLGISKVVYVEMLDKDNTPVLRAKIKMDDGFGQGSFYLPASLTTSNYTLRAYTKWMQNFDASFFFSEKITVANTLVSPEVATMSSKNSYDIQFFPEGGALVAGLTSKVGFRVTDDRGKGIPFTGVILNNRGETVSTFQPLKFGMGHFVLTPNKEKYTAVITDSKGNRHSVSLPEAKEAGYVMQLKEDVKKIYIDVTAANVRDGFIYLLAHTRQIKVKTESKLFTGERVTFSVDKSELPEGVSHFTLFDDPLTPVCERVYFKRPEKMLQLGVSASVAQAGLREKVTIDISSDAPAHLSVAVVAKDSLTTPASTIWQNLFLQSDLKGTIESPEFYFNKNDTLVVAATDNLMLTHGWRRFVWSDLLNSSREYRHFPEVHGPVLEGTVTDAEGKPVHGSTIYVASPDKAVRVYGATSNLFGRVFFEVKDLWGPRQLYVQPDWTRDSTSVIKISDSFSTTFGDWKLPPYEFLSNRQQTLLKRSVAMQLQNIYYADETALFATPPVDSVAFYGQADETYYLDDYTRFPIMEEVMREYVPGVMVRKRKDHFYLVLLDKTNKSVFRENSLILMDGVPVFDVDKIMAFDPVKVRKLEVINRAYYLGQLMLPGIVSYRTYAGDLAGFPLPAKTLSVNYEGLQLQREFYSPKYDAPTLGKNLPDSRSLLYWSPTVTTNKGKAVVEFYTSDLEGNFEVIVQGISPAGVPGSATVFFSTKK